MIENQLERSNHDHLGKLITYTAFTEARTAIWMCLTPDQSMFGSFVADESAPADFYLLKIEGIRIGDSPPAPPLTLIVGPSEESREAGEAKKDRAERYQIRRRFWTDLLDRAKKRTRLHAALSPPEYGWVGAGAGKSGPASTTRSRGMARPPSYTSTGEDAAENQSVFDSLHDHKDEIENAYGGDLSWEPLEGKRGCRIAQRLTLGGYRDDENNWAQVQGTMIDSMIRLEQALRPFISKLPV